MSSPIRNTTRMQIKKSFKFELAHLPGNYIVFYFVQRISALPKEKNTVRDPRRALKTAPFRRP